MTKKIKRRGKPCSKSGELPSGIDLRQARLDKGFPLAEHLAVASNISSSTIYQCERERRLPRNRTVRAAYMAALGLTEQQVAPQQVPA